MRPERRTIPTPMRPRRPGSGSGPMARRRAIHASDSAPGDFDEVAHNTGMLLAHIAQLESALHVEWEISSFLPCWGQEPARVNTRYVEAMTLAIIDQLEGHGGDVALTVLRGLEAVATGVIADAAGSAATRLSDDGVLAPPWAWQIGQARPVDARSTGVSEDGSFGVLVEYAYPHGDRHVLASFIAGDMGGAVKFMGLAKAFAEALPGSDEGLVPIDAGGAQDALRDALEATDQVHARFRGDPSVSEFGALAWSRVRA